jgi:hypothetical protein
LKNIYAVYLCLILLPCVSCTNKRYKHVVWIDQIIPGPIFNINGPPNINSLFTGDSIILNGVYYERGLSTIPPSDITISIEAFPVIFEATLGNSIISPGENEVIYKVFADNILVYESVPISSRRNEKISLRLDKVKKLRLVTEMASDSIPSLVNSCWAMAKLKFMEEMNPASLEMTSFPKAILHNRIGYKPNSLKTCLIPIELIDSLYIYESETDSLVYKNTIDIMTGDFGFYLKAGFSQLTLPGTYYMKSAGIKSKEFVINENIFRDLSFSHLTFLENNPTDLPSSEMEINDAYSQTLILHALSHYFENCNDPFIKSKIFSEYSKRELSVRKYMDNIAMLHFPQNKNLLIEISQLEGEEQSANHNFELLHASTKCIYALSQARMAKLYKHENIALSNIWLSSAVTSYREAKEKLTVSESNYIGLSLSTASELYRVTGNGDFKREAEVLAGRLLLLMDDSNGLPSGFFRQISEDSTVLIENNEVCINWPLTGLCLYLSELKPGDRLDYFKSALDKYCNSYLAYLAGENAFSLIPYGLYNSSTTFRQSNGPYSYRYFPQHSSPDKCGNTSFIASTAAGLIMASKILNQPGLSALAQKQFDWIYGHNPFNFPLSVHMKNVDDVNTYPWPGGVLSGISSDSNDNPSLFTPVKPFLDYNPKALASLLWLNALMDTL